MKKIIWPFSILVALLTFTYFFEEIGKQDKLTEEEKHTTAFGMDFSKILSIKTTGTNLTRKEEQFFGENLNFSIDPQKIEDLFSLLGQIRVKRFFSPEEILNSEIQNQFSETDPKISFIFPNEEIIYQLGSKVEFSTDFYFKIHRGPQSSIVLASDESTLPFLYNQEDAKSSPYKYLRLKELFTVKEEFFYNKRVLSSKHDIKEIHFDIKDHQQYKLTDLGKTEPNTWEGVRYAKDIIQGSLKRISELRAQKIDLTKELGQLVSKIDITYKDGSKEQLELFSTINQDNYFVKRKESEARYFITNDDALLFLADMQAYWDKRAIAEEDSLGVQDEKIQLAFKNDLFELTIPKSENLVVQISNNSNDKLKANQQAIITLLQLLTGGQPFFQADRISKLNPTYEKLFEQLPSFSIKLRGFDLMIYQKGEELIITDHLKKINLHYFLSKDLIPGVRATDYFYYQE